MTAATTMTAAAVSADERNATINGPLSAVTLILCMAEIASALGPLRNTGMTMLENAKYTPPVKQAPRAAAA
ncbi:hypothetical protein GCM10027416_16160 [Okibacterium endophyticum]